MVNRVQFNWRCPLNGDFEDQTNMYSYSDDLGPGDLVTIDALTAMVLDRDKQINKLERDVLGWRTLVGLFLRSLAGPTIQNVDEQGTFIRVPDRLIEHAQGYTGLKIYLERSGQYRGWELVVTGEDLLTDWGIEVLSARELITGKVIGDESVRLGPDTDPDSETS